MRDFASYHPWSLFIYFLILIGFTMFTTQPVMVVLAFVFSQALYYMVSSKKQFYQHLAWMILILCVIGISNPIFVHQGISILFYVNGNPITVEAILYGFAFGGMICSVVTQFAVLQKVITSDKSIYLFSKTIPTIGLIISMTLRLIPKFQKRAKEVILTQKVMGFDMHHGSLFRRIRIAVMIFSMMITWAFESSIDSADSMRARGYGAHRRTHFSIFKFEQRDKAMLGLCILICIGFGIAYQTSFSHFYYYPSVYAITFRMSECLGYVSYSILCFIPLGIEWRGQVKWKSVQSKI